MTDNFKVATTWQTTRATSQFFGLSSSLMVFQTQKGLCLRLSVRPREIGEAKRQVQTAGENNAYTAF